MYICLTNQPESANQMCWQICSGNEQVIRVNKYTYRKSQYTDVYMKTIKIPQRTRIFKASHCLKIHNVHFKLALPVSGLVLVHLWQVKYSPTYLDWVAVKDQHGVNVRVGNYGNRHICCHGYDRWPSYLSCSRVKFYAPATPTPPPTSQPRDQGW